MGCHDAWCLVSPSGKADKLSGSTRSSFTRVFDVNPDVLHYVCNCTVINASITYIKNYKDHYLFSENIRGMHFFTRAEGSKPEDLRTSE